MRNLRLQSLCCRLSDEALSVALVVLSVPGLMALWELALAAQAAGGAGGAS